MRVSYEFPDVPVTLCLYFVSNIKFTVGENSAARVCFTPTRAISLATRSAFIWALFFNERDTATSMLDGKRFIGFASRSKL